MNNLKKDITKKTVLVFDLDGTIVKLNADWSHLKNKLSERFYHVYGEKIKFKTITECLNQVMAREDESELKAIFTIVQDFEIKNIKNTELIEETIFFINNLNHFGLIKQVHLAILSLNTRETIKQSLVLAKLDHKFSFIIGKENVRNWKPHPEGLLKIKEHFGASNEEMIYFGDLKKDVHTGMNAGIDTYLIDQLILFVKEKRNL